MQIQNIFSWPTFLKTPINVAKDKSCKKIYILFSILVLKGIIPVSDSMDKKLELLRTRLARQPGIFGDPAAKKVYARVNEPCLFGLETLRGEERSSSYP